MLAATFSNSPLVRFSRTIFFPLTSVFRKTVEVSTLCPVYKQAGIYVWSSHLVLFSHSRGSSVVWVGSSSLCLPLPHFFLNLQNGGLEDHCCERSTCWRMFASLRIAPRMLLQQVLCSGVRGVAIVIQRSLGRLLVAVVYKLNGPWARFCIDLVTTTAVMYNAKMQYV